MRGKRGGRGRSEAGGEANPVLLLPAAAGEGVRVGVGVGVAGAATEAEAASVEVGVEVEGGEGEEEEEARRCISTRYQHTKPHTTKKGRNKK